MENWLIELLKILGGAIAGVLLTEFLPSIKAFFRKSSLSIRHNRIEYIKKEYRTLKAYKENHATLVVEILRLLTNRLRIVFIIIGLAIVGIYTKLDGGSSWIVENIGIIMGVFLGIMYSDFEDIQRLISKVGDFEKYREKAVKDLEKLGTSLDEETPGD